MGKLAGESVCLLLPHCSRTHVRLFFTNNHPQTKESKPDHTTKPPEFYITEYPPASPIYTEYALGLNYACECLVSKRPDAPFGSRSTPFPNKKAARANAAREALLWLQENGYAKLTTGPDGTMVVSNNGNGKKRKGKSGGMGIVAEIESVDDEGKDVGKERSFAARVNGSFCAPNLVALPTAPTSSLPSPKARPTNAANHPPQNSATCSHSRPPNTASRRPPRRQTCTAAPRIS